MELKIKPNGERKLSTTKPERDKLRKAAAVLRDMASLSEGASASSRNQAAVLVESIADSVDPDIDTAGNEDMADG